MRTANTIAMGLLMACGVLRAEVTDVGTNGFTVAHAVRTPASASTVFERMTRGVGVWWLASHTWSGDASRLSIDPKAGGCFCETLPNGGSVEHLRVVYFDPDRLLRMHGGLGPLQEMGLQGAMTWQVAPAETGSTVEWRYAVHGHLPGGFGAIAGAVDSVLGQQLQSLAATLGSD